MKCKYCDNIMKVSDRSANCPTCGAFAVMSGGHQMAPNATMSFDYNGNIIEQPTGKVGTSWHWAMNRKKDDTLMIQCRECGNTVTARVADCRCEDLESELFCPCISRRCRYRISTDDKKIFVVINGKKMAGEFKKPVAVGDVIQIDRGDIEEGEQYEKSTVASVDFEDGTFKVSPPVAVTDFMDNVYDKSVFLYNGEGVEWERA